MKRTTLMICLSGLFLSLHAQNLKVPGKVEQAFHARFPKARNVKWEKENKNEYEAGFTVNDVKMSANFLTDGKWMETETTIPVSELPLNGVSAIKARYPSAAITEAARIEQKGKTLFEVELKLANRKAIDVMMDKAGVLVPVNESEDKD